MNAPPDAPAQADPGLVAVELIYELMQIDDQWSVRRDRGFTWWAYRLAQHVEASPPFPGPDGSPACQIRIWTDIAHDVSPKDVEKNAELVALANAYEELSAVIWDGVEHTITECSTSTVYADTVRGWAQVLSTAATIQNANAHARAHSLAEALGGTLTVSNHPKSGERPEMDEMLNLRESLARDFAGESRFSGALVQQVNTPTSPVWQLSSMTNGSATALTAEFPFSGQTPAAALAATGAQQGLETSLLQIFTEEPNPTLGSGALIVMKLPFKVPKGSADSAAIIANALNFMEGGSTDTEQFKKGRVDVLTSLLGAWCVDPTSEDRDSVAFVSFVPSILAKPGVLENMCVYDAYRSQWAWEALMKE